MKQWRFYQRPINPGLFSLVGSEARHIATVLRLRVGEQIELFDGAGASAAATIERLEPRRVDLQVQEIHSVLPRTSGRIIIVAGVAKGERFDWLIGKCTELGADHICPIIFERTVKKSQGNQVLARYEKLTIAAAKQSGRLFLPIMESPMNLTDGVAKLQSVYPDADWLLGDWGDQADSLAQRQWDHRDVIGVVGPEGGLTDKERFFLIDLSARPTRLAQTILRVETAAISFAAILASQRLAAECRE